MTAAEATDCQSPGRAWHGPMGGAPMNSARTGTFRSALLVAIAWWVVNSHAWAQTTPNPVMPPATPQPAAEGGGAAIAAIGLVVGLLVIIGVVVKVFDLKQKRESEAVQLQAQLSDALLREPSLAGLPLTPTVHVPMWKGTPATIELALDLEEGLTYLDRKTKE